MRQETKFAPVKSYFWLLFFLALSLAIFLKRNSSLVRNVAGFTERVFARPKEFLYRVKTGLIFSSGLSSAQIKKLQEENKALIEKQADYQKLADDNLALRSQFENVVTQSKNLLPVQVVGFSGSFGFPNALIISAGLANGLVPGLPVILDTNLVGMVKTVQTSFSQVILPNNEEFSALGKTLAGGRGIIKGRNDFITFDHVVITDKILENDTVVTAGDINKDGVGIPPNLTVGSIISINKNDNQPFQSSQIKNLVDYARLNLVFVIMQNER